MSAVDDYRLAWLKSVSNLQARTIPWPGYQAEIREIVGKSPDAQAIFEIGSKLKRIFKSETRTRSQSDLSRGGASWEILVTWYLNLVFWDTNVVAIRPTKQFLPSVVADAMAVTIKGVVTSKEADVIVIEVPKTSETMQKNQKAIDLAIRQNPKLASLGVVQCKTNWNDNAQIPMLWNLVYAAQNLSFANAAVGLNGFSPSSFGRFTYAFFTVPTNTEKDGKDNFRSDSTAVVRVQGMTGGNYWGNTSQSGVAASISEYFGRNFAHVFDGGVQHHIATRVLADPDVFENFLNFDF